ncbi:MAG: SulP family inorganic anion transporter [Planctomycetota bacterium]
MSAADTDSPSRNFAHQTVDYLRSDLRADAVAGLTVAVMGVPQAMAYALIAGLPPVYGLYTAIVTCVIAAVIGSSSHLVTGPTNALCMVILSLTAHLPAKYDITLLEAVFFLTFLTGFVQVLFGVLRLGGIVRYVSNSVVVGFTAGAGVMIAANQLKNLLGIDLTGVHAERFHEVVIATIQRLPDVNPYAAAVGAVTVVVVVTAGRIHQRLPGALLAIAIGGALSYFLGWHLPEMGANKVDIVKDIEPISGKLMGFSVPSLVASPNYELTRELGLGAVALAILGLIEAASIARAVAATSGQRLRYTREFVGQGASNMVGSFLGCFAGSGSFTRTAVCFKSGGRTRMAAIFSAVWTLVALLLLGPIANFIPKAALAGILIVVAYSMIDKHHLKLSWTSGANPRLVLVGTLVSTLLLPLEYAVFVGVFLSIFILLRTTGKTDLTQLVPTEDSSFEEVPFNQAAPSPVVTINMEGDLYFAAAEDLDYELLRSLRPETRVVVLRMKRLRAVGATAMAMLGHFWELLRARNVHLVASGIEEELAEVLTGSGLRKQIGEQNLFYADNRLFQSTELAMARAWSIVRHEQSTSGVGTAEGASCPHIRARDLVSTRSIRFGYQHQLREAVWLMSGLLEHSKALSPEPLFLQSREARLYGELSPWAALRTLAAKTKSADAVDLSDADLAERLRQDLATSIATIARRDVGDLYADATLGEIIAQSLELDQSVVPICHDDGRLQGQVTSEALLRGLDEALHKLGEEEPSD